MRHPRVFRFSLMVGRTWWGAAIGTVLGAFATYRDDSLWEEEGE